MGRGKEEVTTMPATYRARMHRALDRMIDHVRVGDIRRLVGRVKDDRRTWNPRARGDGHWHSAAHGEDARASIAAAFDRRTGDAGIEAYGVKGLRNVPWRKVFRNQAEFERWLDQNEGEVEVYGTREAEPGARDSRAADVYRVARGGYYPDAKTGKHVWIPEGTAVGSVMHEKDTSVTGIVNGQRLVINANLVKEARDAALPTNVRSIPTDQLLILIRTLADAGPSPSNTPVLNLLLEEHRRRGGRDSRARDITVAQLGQKIWQEKQTRTATTPKPQPQYAYNRHGERVRVTTPEDEERVARRKIIAALDRAAGRDQVREAIRPGDIVTISTPQGQTRSGKAVMKGPHGWVLNMGGAHGTTAIATEQNIVHVKATGRKAGPWGL